MSHDRISRNGHFPIVNGGMAVSTLRVRAAEVPGRWVIVDRRFVPVWHDPAWSRSELPQAGRQPRGRLVARVDQSIGRRVPARGSGKRPGGVYVALERGPALAMQLDRCQADWISIESRVYRYARKSLLELFPTGIGDVSASELKGGKVGQAPQMHQPAIGDLRAGKIEVNKLR